MENELLSLSTQIGEILIRQALTIAAAESCTGGLLSHILTNVSSSSGYFIGGVVAYSNQIKKTVLGVSDDTLEKYGAVSWQTAQEMAKGIAQEFNTHIGLSTTGIAGPTGGTPDKPVGLVWIGIHIDDINFSYECHFNGNRAAVKKQTVKALLIKLLDLLKSEK